MSEKLSSQLKKAKQLLKIGDLISALAVVEELKNKHDDVPDVWALDGEIAIRQQRIKDAMTAVDQAAKLEPDNAERHIQRARCYIVAGDTDEALK